MANEEKFLDYLKRLRLTSASRRRLREIEERDREPVAIVGMGAGFPVVRAAPRSYGSCWPARVTDLRVPGGPGWDLDSLYDPDPVIQVPLMPARAGSLRRRRSLIRVLRDEPAGGAGDGSPAAAAARDLLGGARTGGDDPATMRGSETGVFVGHQRANYPAIWRARRARQKGIC